MPSKELTNEVANFLRNISVSSDNGGSYDEYECKEKAEELLSTILAALQEPTGAMKYAAALYTNGSHDLARAAINAAIYASPLGEQSE
ncbi:hypothetical protein H9643_19080 [Ochrobactrum sp. Sa2BUA5]|nr:hypothetical protein [Ochrobactrum gallinarum]